MVKNGKSRSDERTQQREKLCSTGAFNRDIDLFEDVDEGVAHAIETLKRQIGRMRK
jgi:hypothetical protein